MKPERWKQIEQLYHAALDREPDERAAFLAETCIDDSGLRREVEELLRYDGAAGSFIQGNALAFEARRLKPEELSQTAPQLLPGQNIGAYKILALLAAGGMGVVYRARDERLRRDVAIKVLPTSFAHDADRLRRFEQEAHATSALNHPNILTIYDIGAQDGAPFIVAELLEGEELRAQLESGAVPVRRALEYAQQIATGLAAAHAKGIVHRDLKPENLFVTSVQNNHRFWSLITLPRHSFSFRATRLLHRASATRPASGNARSRLRLPLGCLASAARGRDSRSRRPNAV
jgi:serine/threonine protein kinase